MGYLLSAECPCGFAAEVPLGAGRMSFRTQCDFPCYCEHCGNLVAVNLMAPAQHCPLCGAAGPKRYDHPDLHERGSAERVASWSLGSEELQITNARYRCPGCKALSLRFHTEMLFD